MPSVQNRAPSLLGLRLSWLLVALLGISLVFVLANVYVVHTIQGDAAWLTAAGRRRMQSYQVLYLARRAALPEAEPAEPVRQRLRAAARDMDEQLARLAELAPVKDLQGHFAGLEADWHGRIEPILRRVLAGPAPAEALALVAELDAAVERHLGLVDELMARFARLSEAHFARLRLFLRVTFAAMLVMLGVLLWLLRDVNRRIRSLVAVAGRLAAGEAGVRLPVEGRDELDVLGTAFNEMAARRQKADEDLRESQERFTLFMDHLPGVAFIKDREGRFVYVNPTFERSFGDGWTGRLDVEQWPAPLAERLRENDRFAISRGAELQTVETVPAQGGIRHFLVGKFPIPGPGGGPALLGGVGIDITDRKAAEDALQETAARYQAIVDLAVDALITIDEQGRIESFNNAAERIFGYAANELLGRNVSLLMPSPYREEHDQYLAAYLKTGVAHIIGSGRELIGQRKDGSLFPLELAVTEIRLQGRRIFTGTARDLTQRRRAEVLAQMGVFASGLAHEIGTPMNVILGRAEFVRGQLAGAPSARHLDVIIEQVERIARLIQQLLGLTRPHPLERRPTDVNQVVEATLDAVQERLRKRRIGLDLRLDPTLPRAEVDPDRMGQLVLNLVVNAIDAMSEKGGALRVATSAHAAAGGKPGVRPDLFELSVSDAGCGIPAEHLVQIFTPFFTTKDPGRGTGLGLSVVQGIVRDHGGDVLVESEVGSGTTVRVRLPLSAKLARPRAAVATDMPLPGA